MSNNKHKPSRTVSDSEALTSLGYLNSESDNPASNASLEPSKSARKRAMNQLQQLAAKVAQLKLDTRLSLQLPISLDQSIEQARQLKSSNARNRQLRHSAKILLSEPETVIAIESYFEKKIKQAQFQNGRHKVIELWRDKLIQGDKSTLSDFFDDYPEAPRQELSTLVRNARNEWQKQNKQPNPLVKPVAVQQRKLFKFIRDDIIRF